MGAKGGGGGGTQTVTQKTELPGWVTEAAQKNLNQAYNVSQAMPGPYSGPRYAGMTDGALANVAGLQLQVGQTQPGYELAKSGAAGLMNYRPQNVQAGSYNAALVGGVPQVEAGSLANANLSAYMNPYTSGVVDYGLKALETQRLQAMNGIADQAIRARAFGGSRQGVAEGVTNAGAALNAGKLASDLMSQNFLQGQAAATGDIGRGMAADQMNQAALMQAALSNQNAQNSAAQYNIGSNLQAQLANQQAGLSGAGLNLSAANALGTLTGQGQAAYLDSLRSALAGQGLVQQDKQGQYDAARQAYTENQQFPLQQLQIPLQALGMTPYPTSTTTTGPAQSSGSGLLQGIGAGASAIGALGSLATAFGWSDETMKTDIKKVGKDDETGLNLYAYRYKGDPKTYPKVVGPMAQDIAKKYPDQVHEVGGKLAVNLGFGPMRKAFH